MYVDQLMYWVSRNSLVHSGSTVEMSSLDGTGQVMLLNEAEAKYTGITLYNNFLYISDQSGRLAFYTYIVPTSTTKNYERHDTHSLITVHYTR